MAAVVTVLAGRWSIDLARRSEFVHFSVNFPTQPGHPQRSRGELGGPWVRLSAAEWRGIPAGGTLAYGREGEIVVDLGGRSWLKRWLQPGDLTLSSHWLRNVGTRPYRLRLALEMCGLPIEWVTFERHWDPTTRTSTRTIEPGALFNMDWMVTLPAARRAQRRVCDGLLQVEDADDGRLLTRLPMRIVNSRAAN